MRHGRHLRVVGAATVTRPGVGVTGIDASAVPIDNTSVVVERASSWKSPFPAAALTLRPTTGVVAESPTEGGSRLQPPLPIVLPVTRLRRGRQQAPLGFTIPVGSWVVQVCHPDWRGVRASSYAFRTPVVEAADLNAPAPALVAALLAAGTRRIVIQGWPPGATALARQAHDAGIAVAAVSHASLAQHGTDAGEAERVTEVLALAREGVIDRIGFLKHGLPEVFRHLGYEAHELLNRVPDLPATTTADLGPGRHVGVILDPYWRKNVTTQVAAALLLGAIAHVMRAPQVPWLPEDRVVAHGDLPPDRFLPLLAGMEVNLHVTLSECHPMTPMESYLLGVPCLISRTSVLFEDDPELLRLSSVVEIDDPSRIAAQAEDLVANRIEAISRARASLVRMDERAAQAWDAFLA